jgi:hypothetical protein
MGTCRRLESDRVEPGYLFQGLTKVVHESQRPLDRRFRLQRVEIGKTRECGKVLVHLGIVLHRAGTEGIKAPVEVMVLYRQGDKVTDEVHFADLRHPDSTLSQQVFREQLPEIFLRDIALGKGCGCPPGRP